MTTQNSSDAPSPTTTLAVVFSYAPYTILTSASGTPIHRSIAITISLGTVSRAFSKSTNPRAILPCTSSLFSTICLRTYIPSAVPLPFLNPCCSSPKSPSTLLLILASKPLSSSFSTWLSSVMPLYFPGSCTSPVLFHIGTTRPILHSFGILPSCIHTFSSLPVHMTPPSPASLSSPAALRLPLSPCLFYLVHCCFHCFLSYLLHFHLSPNGARELEATCCSCSGQ